MLVPSLTLSESILAKLPEMRAFARLMVSNRRQADDYVAAALTLAMSNKQNLRKHGDLRLALFAILRKCIAQNSHKASGDIQAFYSAENGSATAIEKAVMQLSFEEREAVILRVAANFSLQEIAVICECTVPTVESRLRDAAGVLH